MAEVGEVLVLDDDPAVTRVVRRALGSNYLVTECDDPFEALAAIERGDRYDLILCDVTMPGLGGEAFHRAVRDVSPELAERIVFVTGLDSSAPGAKFLHSFRPERCISKPFHIDQLRVAVADFLRVSGRWKARAAVFGRDLGS